jgi:ParB family chromosome partitioning protein
MARKTGLGRGLDALIPGENILHGEIVQQIQVELISPNPRQPRQKINPEELSELAYSIREHGILQPIVVTVDPQDLERYVLITGQRRLEAARLNGMKTVPALIRDADDQQRLELALVENLQRKDLNPLEQADAYYQLNQEFGLTHEEIATRVGKNRTTITNIIRLRDLPGTVKNALKNEQISEGHARSLLQLVTTEQQIYALSIVLQKGLTVRQTEALVKRMNEIKIQKTTRAPSKPEERELEERFRQRLGTKVSLNRHGNTGTLTFYFYSDEELESIIASILGTE